MSPLNLMPMPIPSQVNGSNWLTSRHINLILSNTPPHTSPSTLLALLPSSSSHHATYTPSLVPATGLPRLHLATTTRSVTRTSLIQRACAGEGESGCSHCSGDTNRGIGKSIISKAKLSPDQFNTSSIQAAAAGDRHRLSHSPHCPFAASSASFIFTRFTS
jgi:hypothetical protein